MKIQNQKKNSTKKIKISSNSQTPKNDSKTHPHSNPPSNNYFPHKSHIEKKNGVPHPYLKKKGKSNRVFQEALCWILRSKNRLLASPYSSSASALLALFSLSFGPSPCITLIEIKKNLWIIASSYFFFLKKLRTNFFIYLWE